VSALQTVVAVLGLGLITFVTRGFFLLSERELPLPRWLQQGLRYAPLAALAAVVVPEIVMTPDGRLISSLADARLYAAAAGAAWFWWRRGILGTIVAGSVVMLVLSLIMNA